MSKVDFDSSKLPSVKGPISLALGNFDGMHLGHAEVLFNCVYDASYETAILFLKPTPEAKNTHPFLSKDVLMSEMEKEIFATNKKIEWILSCFTNEDFYEMTPDEFIENVLKPLNVKEIFCGEDYTFGRLGKGNVNLLKEHFKVNAAPLLEIDGEKISSTRIKQLIREGDVEYAKKLLGHPYQNLGIIVPGFQRGRSLGFPTANLAFQTPYVLPKIGVYYGLCYLSGIAYPSIINVGSNPTFGNHELTVEAHLIGYEGADLYGKSLYVSYYGRLRDEHAFDDEKALIEQLEIDRKNALSLLAN